MKTRILPRILLTTAAFTVLAPHAALACGDNLYRVGKGVPYRVYFAPLPGNVLVYGGGTEGARQLADALEESGHGVRFAENEDELTTALEESDYDVVIGPYSQHETVESRDAGKKVRFLPVALTEEEAVEARGEYDDVMIAESAELKHYLKSIHAVVKQKQ